MTTANEHRVDGHEARSAQTRSRLIEAAIEVIGAVGFDAASTRALAKAADANLSAIPYHFGGKKELYLAAAQAIADHARARFAEVADILDPLRPGEKAGRLEAALVHLFRVVLEDVEPRAWTPFVARCAYENDDAFTIIHQRAVAPMLERLVQSASELLSIPPARDADLRLRVGAVVATILSFRFFRGLVTRSMEWRQIQPGGADQIEDMIRSLCRSDFLRFETSR